MNDFSGLTEELHKAILESIVPNDEYDVTYKEDGTWATIVKKETKDEFELVNLLVKNKKHFI